MPLASLHSLTPHPESPSRAVHSLTAEVSRSGQQLAITYTVNGDIDAIVWPAAASPARTDELWNHTCFEAFVGTADAPLYAEFNMSPSSEWAAYLFEDVKIARTDADVSEQPVLSFARTETSATAHTTFTVDADIAGTWHINITAVIEEADGTVSFWALRHSLPAPNFHSRDGFTLTLDA